MGRGGDRVRGWGRSRGRGKGRRSLSGRSTFPEVSGMLNRTGDREGGGMGCLLSGALTLRAKKGERSLFLAI